MPKRTQGARITLRLVETFLQGVGASGWRVAYGPFSPEGRLSREDGKRHEELTAAQVIALIPFLRAKNAEGASIYVGPMQHDVLYVDDVEEDGTRLLADLDLPMIAVVETSPGSHQIWFPVPAETTAWELSAALCQLLGGDDKAHESSAGLQPRIGRLPGFTNTKPNRRRLDGLYPFVRLIRSAGAHRPTADQLNRLAGLASRNSAGPIGLPLENDNSTNGTHAAGRAGAAARVKADLRSAGSRGCDGPASGRSEADWRNVRRMLRAGASFERCVEQLRTARPDKPADYAARTVARAATSVGLRRLVPNDPVLQRFCDMYLRSRRR